MVWKTKGLGNGTHRHRSLSDNHEWRIEHVESLCRALQLLRLCSERLEVADDLASGGDKPLRQDDVAADGHGGDCDLEHGELHFG